MIVQGTESSIFVKKLEKEKHSNSKESQSKLMINISRN